MNYQDIKTTKILFLRILLDSLSFVRGDSQVTNKAFKQIYPADCYRVLLMLSGKTGISFPKVVNIVVREGLIRLNPILESLGIPAIPEDTSEANLLSETPLIKPKEESGTVMLNRETLKIQSILITIKKAISKGEEVSEKSLLYAKQRAEQFKNILPEANELLELLREKEMLEKIKKRID